MNGDSLKNVASASQAKMGVAAAGGAGAVALGTMLIFNHNNTQALLIMVGGLLFVTLLVLLYLVVTKNIQARVNARGDEELMDELRGTPKKITDPEILARMAGISRKFEEGVGKFKANGVKLTELPWYLIVGESGSGKTEVVRHSGIEFPAGLTEDQQGAGGTVNMDWWFTDHGVIIDTAGRYVSDKIDASAEFDRFLSLLAKVRKDCPINGMLLVIPATSLLKDPADGIQVKAAKTAKFIDRVRRGLGVRFPVFVIITKSDLIPGFREFFENITDPDLQHQMLGWSKPGSLDEAFDPDAVDKYLREITGKLLRRRLALLRQPPVTDELEGKRKVDSLYLFPDSLMQIAPRLRRYLQGIFIKSKFNQSPLFLRGIYFTSAMEEGAELDEALAKIRGITMEQLEQQGQGHRRERAVFLRDLFMQKIFRESGLVTRAVNVNQTQRRRKVLLLGSGFACVALLFLLTWMSALSLKRDIGSMEDDWNNADRLVMDAQWKIVDGPLRAGKYSYQDGNFDGHRTSVQFLADQAGKISSKIPVPAIFRMTVAPTSHLDEHWHRAYAALVNYCIVTPVVQHAEEKMRSLPPAGEDGGLWTKEGAGTKALIELIHLHEPSQPFQLERVMQYLALPGTTPDYASLKNIVDAAYHGNNSQIAADTGSLVQNLRAGVNAMNDYWQKQLAGDTGPLKPFSDLGLALNAWKKASGQIEGIQLDTLDSSHPYGDEWGPDFAQLGKAYKQLHDLQTARGQDWDDAGDDVATLYANRRQRIHDHADAALQLLYAQIPESSTGDLKSLRDAIYACRSNLNLKSPSTTELQAQLQANQAILKMTADGKMRVYELLYTAAKTTNGFGKAADPPPPAWSPNDVTTISGGSPTAQAASQKVKSYESLCGNDPLSANLARKLADLLQNAVIPLSKESAINGVMAALSKAGSVEAIVIQMGRDLSPQNAARLPTFDNSVSAPKNWPKYRYDLADGVMATITAVDKALNSDTPVPLSDRDALQQQWTSYRDNIRQYAEKYCQYWSGGVFDVDGVFDDFLPPPQSWKDAAADFRNADVGSVDGRLRELSRMQFDALQKAGWLNAWGIKPALENVQRDQDAFCVEGLDNRYTQRAQSWGQNTAAQTIAVLTNISPTDFTNDWQMSDVCFWKHLQLLALDKLAIQAQNTADSNLAKFTTTYGQKFPLVKQTTDRLNPDTEYADALQLLQSIVPGALNANAAVGDSDYAATLEKLRQVGPVLRKDHNRLQTQLLILATMKTGADPDAWAHCTLSILPKQRQKDLCETAALRRAELNWPSVVLASPSTQSKELFTHQDHDAILGDVGVETPLTFTFISPGKDKDHPEEYAHKMQAWSCLELLVDPAARKDPDNSWIVPVRFNSQGQGTQEECLWLRMELPKNLPDPQSWPSGG